MPGPRDLLVEILSSLWNVRVLNRPAYSGAWLPDERGRGIRYLTDANGSIIAVASAPFIPRNAAVSGVTAIGMQPDSFMGGGIPVEIAITSPAAGANFALTVPNETYLKIDILKVRVVASTQAATRTLFIYLTSAVGSITPTIALGSPTFVASATRHHTYISRGTVNDTSYDTVNNEVRLALPDVVLPPGSVLNSQLNNIKNLDQIDQLLIIGRIWFYTPDTQLFVQTNATQNR